MRPRRFLLLIASLALAAVAGGQDTVVQDGVASWYGADFHGRTTSNGEVYDMDAFTAAHRTLPFGSRVRVTNQENGRQVVVRINDRGPFVAGRIIDLSRAAATLLDMLGPGTVPVRLEVLAPATPEQRVFAVQVGAFVKAENAQRVQYDLRAAGIEAVLERTPTLVTRVVVDHVKEADLGATLKLVASLGFRDCLVKERRD
jgi:rare lipoprotein A (peptidoglycan hydrolase)